MPCGAMRGEGAASVAARPAVQQACTWPMLAGKHAGRPEAMVENVIIAAAGLQINDK
jgi:hypothetical protein